MTGWCLIYKRINTLAESEVLGGIPSYKPYRYMPPQRIWFLGLFGLKTGIDFAHYTLVWTRVWFSRELRECMNIFILSILNE